MTKISHPEHYLPLALAALVVVPIVAALAASLGEPVGIGQTFLIYLIPQLCLLTLATSLRPDPYFFIGTTVGMAVTLLLHALWELRWHTGPNSMPFFVFLFMATPAVALGILVAHHALSRLLATRLTSILVAFGCTTPFAWLILYSAATNPLIVMRLP